MNRIAEDRTRSPLLFLVVVCLAASVPVSADRWLPFVSDEQHETPARCTSGFVNGLECRGRYCDKVSLSCTYTSSVGRLVDFGRPISDGADDQFECEDGFLLNGLQCSGKYCDNIALSCIEAASGTTDCAWRDDWISEEQGRIVLDDGVYVAGMRCRGDYCDNKQLKTCRTDSPVIKKVHGYWALVDSCAGIGCALTESITIGIDSESSRTKTDEWGQAVTASVEATAGGDDLGGSVTVGLSATMSKSQSNALSKSLKKSFQREAAAACTGAPDAQVRAVYQYQFEVVQECGQTGDCDPTMIGSTETVCVSDPPGGATNYRPRCLPGCCKNANCDECHTTGSCAGG